MNDLLAPFEQIIKHPGMQSCSLSNGILNITVDLNIGDPYRKIKTFLRRKPIWVDGEIKELDYVVDITGFFRLAIDGLRIINSLGETKEFKTEKDMISEIEKIIKNQRDIKHHHLACAAMIDRYGVLPVTDRSNDKIISTFKIGEFEIFVSSEFETPPRFLVLSENIHLNLNHIFEVMEFVK